MCQPVALGTTRAIRFGSYYRKNKNRSVQRMKWNVAQAKMQSIDQNNAGSLCFHTMSKKENEYRYYPSQQGD